MFGCGTRRLPDRPIETFQTSQFPVAHNRRNGNVRSRQVSDSELRSDLYNEGSRDAFREHKEEVTRKFSLITETGFGVAALILPLTISGLFSAFGFRVALDLVGMLFTLNCVGFMVHLFIARPVKQQ